MRQQSDPSVEEILESIKKVIARDTRAAVSDRVAQAAPALHHAPEPASAVHDDDVLDLAASAQFLDTDEDEETLVTEGARSSMRESLAALAMMAQPAAQPQIVRSGETSLEALTRELLRPALAKWLDEHLPAMVERMVAEEIARIVGKKL
jgi:cell pole-organizing protein PopZ